jgi:hypothetical protein
MSEIRANEPCASRTLEVYGCTPQKAYRGDCALIMRQHLSHNMYATALGRVSVRVVIRLNARDITLTHRLPIIIDYPLPDGGTAVRTTPAYISMITSRTYSALQRFW